MAFLRFANARVIQPSTTQKGWSRVRTAAKMKADQSKNLVAQATEILGQAFSPDDYLLTHCTIVASVDVESAPGTVGTFKVGSKTHTRKWADYYITPETSQFVNNNGDSWARETLRNSYRTFVGAHNFLEHVQIEEHSKGRILDAVARDIGNSLYIDILVATHRKHADLVAKIENDELDTLSMGCSVDFTVCTMCGNVAVDEVELCDHIKYQKLNRFIDPNGKQRVIAELCGHHSIKPTGGVTFIEASWVETPAFTGAKKRNKIEVANLGERMAAQAERVLSQPPSEWVGNSINKAASAHHAFEFGEEPGEGEGEDAAPAEDPKGPLDELEDELVEVVLDSTRTRLKDEIEKRQDDLGPEDSTAFPNDTIVKESHRQATAALVRTASTDLALVNGLAELDTAFGTDLPVTLYRAALRVGSSAQYSSLNAYLGACRQSLGRKPTPSEAKGILRLSRCLALRSGRTSTRRSL